MLCFQFQAVAEQESSAYATGRAGESMQNNLLIAFVHALRPHDEYQGLCIQLCKNNLRMVSTAVINDKFAVVSWQQVTMTQPKLEPFKLQDIFSQHQLYAIMLC